MLKKQNIKISGLKESELQLTPGEAVRDIIIQAGVKTTTEADYLAGNKTDSIVEIAKTAKNVIDGGAALVGGGESASALGRIGFKLTKDLGRKDPVCSGLCIISGTCEAVALGCSTVKIIPFRGQIYVGAKIVSKGCIAFRDACVGAGC